MSLSAYPLEGGERVGLNGGWSNAPNPAPILFPKVIAESLREAVIPVTYQVWWEIWSVEVPGWPIIEPEKCKFCGGVGWTAVQHGANDWEQVQCGECWDGYRQDLDWDAVDPYPIERCP